MTTFSLDSIRESLEHQLELADAETGRLKAELKAAEKDRQAIEGALAALGRKKPAKGKPAPKKSQVIAIVAELLEANGPVAEDDLKALIEDRLTSTGTGLSGFGLRFAEAMKDQQFTRTAEGLVSLATAAVTTV